MLLPCYCHAIALQLSCLLGARRASRHLQRVRVRVRGRSCTFHACFFCLLLAPQASNANHSNLPKRAAGLASELKLCHGRRSGFTKQTTQSKTAPAAIPKALAAGSLRSPQTPITRPLRALAFAWPLLCPWANMDFRRCTESFFACEWRRSTLS